MKIGKLFFLLAVIFCMLGVVPAFSQNQVPQTQDTQQTVELPGDLLIKIPEGFTMTSHDGNTYMFSSDSDAVVLTIYYNTIDKVEPGLNVKDEKVLDNVVDSFEQELQKNNKTFKITDRKKKVMDDGAVVAFSGQMVLDGTNVTANVSQVVMFIGNNMYSFGMVCPENLYEKYSSVFESFIGGLSNK